MNKIAAALVAFFAMVMMVPAAHAECDPEDMADCVRSVIKIPSLPRVLPPVVRPPIAASRECDVEDADDLKDCLRRMKVPGAARMVPPGVRPSAELPAERALPPRAEAAPASATVAASEKPTKLVTPEETTLCQRYFPSVGGMVSVPCKE